MTNCFWIRHETIKEQNPSNYQYYPDKELAMTLIERLKKNERPFDLCSEEEQVCFKKVKMNSCWIYNGETWESTHSDVTGITMIGFGNYYTYRIKPDYAPQPKEKKIEIIIGGKTVWSYVILAEE